MASRQERWLELQNLVSQDDGIEVRNAGSWTADKLWWWYDYLNITTGALVDRGKWPYSLVYVDLFAGPGILESKQTGQRWPGSPILAVYTEKPFHRILLCEEIETVAKACENRIHAHGASQRTTVFQGDCNELIEEICNQIPNDALTLAFIDPTGLHAKFETIEKLAQGRQVDLLVLFADRMDIIRNVDLYYRQAHSNLDDVLGPGSGWREKWDSLPNHNASTVSRFFVDIYEEQLARHLGYRVFDNEVLRKPNGAPLYRIMFASKHELGLKFWRESTKQFRSGQKGLQF